MTQVPVSGSNTILRYESCQLRMVSMIRGNLLPRNNSCFKLYSVSIRLFGKRAFESALYGVLLGYLSGGHFL
jgi:hypothetical protein